MASSPTKGARDNPEHSRGGSVHSLEEAQAETHSPSSACLRRLIEDQLPLWPWRQNRQQQQEEEASCSSIPGPLCPMTSWARGRRRAGRQAGGEAGKSGTCCLKEQGDSSLWKGLLLFSKQPALSQITSTLDVLLEASTANAHREEQMAQAGVIGDGPQVRNAQS